MAVLCMTDTSLENGRLYRDPANGTGQMAWSLARRYRRRDSRLSREEGGAAAMRWGDEELRGNG